MDNSREKDFKLYVRATEQLNANKMNQDAQQVLNRLDEQYPEFIFMYEDQLFMDIRNDISSN